MVGEMRNVLTEAKARAVLTAIHQFRVVVGHPATVRDVATWMDQPLGTMYSWLNRLRERGLVERTVKRSLRLTPEGRALIGLPRVVTLADCGPNPVVRLYR